MLLHEWQTQSSTKHRRPVEHTRTLDRDRGQHSDLEERTKYEVTTSESESKDEVNHVLLSLNGDVNRVPYDPDKGHRIRILTMTGLIISSCVAFGAIITGVLIRFQSLPISLGTYHGGNLRMKLSAPYAEPMCSLLLTTLFIQVPIWSIDSAHATALKWTLAAETDKRGRIRLECNSNLRFLHFSHRMMSANGLPANIIMAVCLAIMHGSMSMSMLSTDLADRPYNTVITSLPLIIFGAATLVQVSIAAYAISTTTILTWSSSPFDTAAALVKCGLLKRTPGRCLCSVYDHDPLHNARRPRKWQVSAWISHPHTRHFVLLIWILVCLAYCWTFIVWQIMVCGAQKAEVGHNSIVAPNIDADKVVYAWSGETSTIGLLWGMAFLIVFQCGMLTATACINVAIATSNDEVLWNEATSEHGSDPSPGPLKLYTLSWCTTVLHLSETMLHLLLDKAMSVDAVCGFQARPTWGLYSCFLSTAMGAALTFLTLPRRPGVQPSTYGHLQTLVDLVDCWHPKMYWGDKSPNDSGIGHAGTSDKHLPRINPSRLYGGPLCPGCATAE